jgi:hypothetical protein
MVSDPISVICFLKEEEDKNFVSPGMRSKGKFNVITALVLYTFPSKT